MIRLNPNLKYCLSRTGLVIAFLAFSAGIGQANVNLALLPDTVNVQPGEIFDVELTITEEGSAFNGYDAVIGFDPAVLTFLQRPQSEQEGPLMTEACPNRFHIFEVLPAGDALSLSHVLLCAGVSITGPGVVYQLRFQAGELNTTTEISLLEGTGFFLAGMAVSPVITEDAVVQIGTVSAVLPERPASEFALRAAPNPFNPMTAISFTLPESGWVHLSVFNANGLRVKRLLDDYLGPGRQEHFWDGRDEYGQIVGSGVYFLRLDVAGQREIRTVTLIK